MVGFLTLYVHIYFVCFVLYIQNKVFGYFPSIVLLYTLCLFISSTQHLDMFHMPCFSTLYVYLALFLHCLHDYDDEVPLAAKLLPTIFRDHMVAISSLDIDLLIYFHCISLGSTHSKVLVMVCGTLYGVVIAIQLNHSKHSMLCLFLIIFSLYLVSYFKISCQLFLYCHLDMVVFLETWSHMRESHK